MTDESFINYCNNSNKDDKQFWEEWFAMHPEKINLGNEAREMVQALSITLSESEYQQELERINLAIQSTPVITKSTPVIEP